MQEDEEEVTASVKRGEGEREGHLESSEWNGPTHYQALQLPLSISSCSL